MNKMIGYVAPQYWNGTNSLSEIPEFSPLFDEFTEIAKRTEMPPWYVKYAVLYFTYKGKYYSVGPGRFDTDPRIFDHIVNDLIDRMYEMGAYDMAYSGMLD